MNMPSAQRGIMFNDYVHGNSGCCDSSDTMYMEFNMLPISNHLFKSDIQKISEYQNCLVRLFSLKTGAVSEHFGKLINYLCYFLVITQK